MAAEFLENRVYDEIQLGQTAELQRTLTHDDIALFSKIFGDLNPIHLDEEYAIRSGAKGIVGHSLWATGLISSLLANVLPGPGTVYRGQDVRFHGPVHLGDTLTARIKVEEKRDGAVVVLDCEVVNQDHEPVMNGVAEVVAPRSRIRIQRTELPEVSVRHHDSFRVLLASAEALEPIPTAIVQPCDLVSLKGAMDAARDNLFQPILVGPEGKIRAVAESEGISLGDAQVIHTAQSRAAAERAVELIREGAAEILILPDPDGLESYPIVSLSWILLYQSYPRSEMAAALKDMLSWGLTQGQPIAEQMGYIPLPETIASRARQAVASIQ